MVDGRVPARRLAVDDEQGLILAGLAFLFRETGHERIAAYLDKSCISAVNLSEVIGRFTRDGHNAREVLQQIDQSTIETVPFLAEDAAFAAALVPTTAHLGLSLGDRACLALAAVRKAPAWTSDRAWASLNIGVAIEVIR